MKKSIAAALMIALVSLVAPMVAQAQGTVSGIATSDGSLLGNTVIQLTAADGTVQTTTTNSAGEWSFSNAPAGGFTVEIVVNNDPLSGGLVVPIGGPRTGLVVVAPSDGLSAAAWAAIAAAIAAGVAGGIAVARSDAS